MSEVQSIIFKKDNYSLGDALKFLRENNFRAIKIHETQQSYRFRLKDPSKFNKFRTKKIAKGLSFVIGF